MAYQVTTYPTTLDVPVNPLGSNDTSLFDHAGLEKFQNDAIAALEAKVGVTGSAVTTSTDYKLSGVTGGDKAVSKTGTETLTNKTLTTPTITTPTITTPTVTGALTNNGSYAGSAVLPISLGGTGQTAQQAAIDALLPSQGGNSGKALTTNGSTSSWAIFAQAKFGGSGADGALAISSGTTTIDLTNLAVFVKNYTSISITGTANLAFINPNTNGTVIILKSQGNVTITTSSGSAIDLTGLGGVGGGASAGNGVDGSYSPLYFDNLAHGGIGGIGGTSAGGLASQSRAPYMSLAVNLPITRTMLILPGSGGGSGRSNGGISSGAGGRGAGALLIQCGGAYNFTTGIINGVGTVGGNAQASAVSSAGGGGGGAGAFIGVIYASLTANSGTYSLNGGAGGAGNVGASSLVPGGGGGALLVAGGSAVSGGAGSTGTSDTGTGGAGGAGGGGNFGGGGGGGAGGLVTVVQNTEIV